MLLEIQILKFDLWIVKDIYSHGTKSIVKKKKNYYCQLREGFFCHSLFGGVHFNCLNIRNKFKTKNIR